MKWDDGWELVRRYVGLTETNTYTASNPEHLYVILYNKYTGILRVLLLACRGADYNSAKIELKFDITSQMKTDLLELSREQLSALDKKFTITEFAAGIKYINENNKWFYADFPMMYDPCTCNYKSKLNIISKLITTAAINIEGGITGEIHTQNVGGKVQVQKAGTYSWKNFSSAVNGKVTAVHGSVDKFKTETQKLAENLSRTDTAGKKNAIGQFANFLKDNKFLKAGLNAVPWLKSAIGLIDVFSGGGKTTSGPQEVKLLPLSVNLTAKLSGTISTSNQYHEIIFTNPGSKDAALDPDIYPYYNEVLGVFNLLQNPVIYHETSTSTYEDPDEPDGIFRVRTNKYKFLLDSLKYVLNPAADVTIQNMKVALVVEAQPNQGNQACMDDPFNRRMNPDFVYEGKNANTEIDKFRTDYFDVNCFNERVFTTKSFFWLRNMPQNPPNDISCWEPMPNTYLKFMINLKRNITSTTTQNILYVVTYPMNSKFFDITSNFTNNNSCVDSSVIAPATNTEVNSFCNSSVYYNIDRQSRAFRDSVATEAIIAEKGIGVFPNPNNGTFTYKLKAQKGLLRRIVITDIQGRTIYSENCGNATLGSGFSKEITLNLLHGTYILRAITGKETLTTKIIVSN